ncbi:MAG: NADH-quinone oxidoreductase subunit L [Oligoflexales bacterium]|nr:NADH-quinone oxidoreductase subunit L [Oligoflexales bacterium]
MLIWSIVLLPLLGAILNGLFLRGTRSKLKPHLLGSSCIAISFLLSVYLFLDVNVFHPLETASIFYGFSWISAGALNIPFELLVDPLSSFILLIITGIGTLIHIYAGGYMHEEESTARFFSYLNLFVFMMLLLVLGNNLLVMFVGWEGVGLCSYLLIGYWFSEEANGRAGMKAFVVNRIGDLGFLLGIFLCYKTFGTLSFSSLAEKVTGSTALTPAEISAIPLITLCLFIAACGKSAQIPLYIWLPDAMAGPTPVSALIHAATMVTAGVYMMTRLNFLFYLAPSTMLLIALTGACTAFFAATIALVQNDIKKVLAYSTVSQLGFMVLACGVGAFDAAVFHLFTHACFKALLFLGSGSVIVAMHHKQDMREMGGLAKFMPITHMAFLMGVLAIIGFPGFSGFFSKDEILWKAYIFPDWGPWLWALALAAAICTAFYMLRLLCLTFYGDNRSDHHTREHLHETSAFMWAPLIVLAILSTFVGFLNIPPVIGHIFHLSPIFSEFLSPILHIPASVTKHWSHLSSEHSSSLEWSVMLTSSVLCLASATLSFQLYRRGPAAETALLKKKFPTLYQTLLHKYGIDEHYGRLFVRPLSEMSEFLWKSVDIKFINGFIDGLGRFFLSMSGAVSLLMTGALHRHATLFVLGALSILWWVL